MHTEEEVDQLIVKMRDKEETEAFRYSDKLAKIGNDYVLKKMIELLYDDEYDTKYLAARTLGLMENNEAALEPLLEAINDKRNQHANGGMAEALTHFDCSEKFVDIFRIYLFGNFKVSGIAKTMLDYQEFDITPRTVRKAEKHWNHFSNNTKHDETYEEKRREAESILSDLKALFHE